MQDIYLTPQDSIAAALGSLSSRPAGPVRIHLASGTYHEKLVIQRPHLSFIGESAKDTIIAYDDYAKFIMPDGSKRGTFRSYTVLLDTHDVTMENLTIANLAAPRKKAGQAVALYADGDRLVFKNCRFTGNQDTLFTGPLPPAPKEPGGFTGPKEFAPRINGRQLYDNCYICGNVDFIFGSATAYFRSCHIEAVAEGTFGSKEGEPPVCGYITAASTPKGQAYGYVFDHCNITGSGCPPESVYLGRPWRNYAKTVFLNCTMDSCIHPAGFHDWKKPEAHETVYYAEYNSLGEGGVCRNRAPFTHILTDSEAEYYAIDKVLGEDFPLPSC